MYAPVNHRLLYMVWVLLMTFDLLTCVHSQGAGDVWFSLRNKTYQNNSIVTLEDIGEGVDALLCKTNLVACCIRPYTGNWFALGNWLFPNGTKVSSFGDFYTTRGQMVVRLHRRRGGVEGIYSCVIPDSRNVKQTIYIGVYTTNSGAGDVWFSLRGTTYQNNSCVALEDIGEGNDALLCVTNLTACCRIPYTGENRSFLGNWFFPNGTVIPSSGNQWDFHRTRGQMAVRLHRRRGGVEGIYRCKIPDSMNVIQTIYIGVYSANTSTGTKDVWFSLNGTTYQNNSIVALEDIGEGDDALLCVTNQITCCGLGFMWLYTNTWFFPNGTGVPSIGDFYRSRGQMSVHLNRRRGGVEGIFRCEILDSMNVIQTIYIGVYTASTASLPPQTVRATATTTRTVPISNSVQSNNGAITKIISVSSSTQPIKTVGATATTRTVPVSSSTQPTKTVGATVATGTAPFSSSIPPTNNPPSDGSTTTSVIIVAVVIILVIVVGVVILVVLFRTKKRKQMLVINKLQTNTIQNADIEVKLKQEETIMKEASSSVDHPLYEVSNLLYQSMDKRRDPPSTTSVPQGNNFYTVPNTTSSHTNEGDSVNHPLYEVSNLLYQSMDQHHDPPSTTNVPQETDVYTEPDTTSSYTVGTQGGIYEAVYSEPIQPSLFTDAVGSPSHCEHLQPYAPIYTIPTALPKSEVLLKVSGRNIREIHELGMGIFGKVILAETVGLSAKDLMLNESDDNKSKSMLVAVKKLKSGAPSTTKEAFEKEVNFMSRLTDRNVIRILGVCYEDTPFIMMEYMEKGDLNQYLRKFKTLSTVNSEPQGQITTSTLVHMATQIASAMKYLASHNFVHRDLATRNCLVGPNYLVKISNLGMSRDLYESHYYRITGHASLPVRWMSIECFYGKFSQKSDVWAFGVTMWEIFSLAKKQPYNDMSDKQVIEDAIKSKNRKLLTKPKMCPLEVYETMLKCWAHNPKQRTTFDELFKLLTSIHSNQ